MYFLSWKNVFAKKRSLTTRIEIGLKKKAEKMLIWSTVLYRSKAWAVTKIKKNYIKKFQLGLSSSPWATWTKASPSSLHLFVECQIYISQITQFHTLILSSLLRSILWSLKIRWPLFNQLSCCLFFRPNGLSISVFIFCILSSIFVWSLIYFILFLTILFMPNNILSITSLCCSHFLYYLYPCFASMCIHVSDPYTVIGKKTPIHALYSLVL